jgi:hypothetical protein
VDPAAGRPQADGHVAKFTFTSPAAGFVDLTAHFGIRVHATADCHLQSRLAASPGAPSPGAGYMDNLINGNLPTQLGSGNLLQLDDSVSSVLPVGAGSNSFYLNGASSCADALWGPINMTALFVNSNPAATLTAP